MSMTKCKEIQVKTTALMGLCRSGEQNRSLEDDCSANSKFRAAAAADASARAERALAVLMAENAMPALIDRAVDEAALRSRELAS